MTQVFHRPNVFPVAPPLKDMRKYNEIRKNANKTIGTEDSFQVLVHKGRTTLQPEDGEGTYRALLLCLKEISASLVYLCMTLRFSTSVLPGK